MTLIAFATYGKRRAEFITDSIAYSGNVAWTGHATKHLTLNHLDAAVLIQGPLDFGNAVRGCALGVSAGVANFDELSDGAPSWLAEVRQMYRDEMTAGWCDPTVILLGWSDRAQEFVGYVYASEQDFAPSAAAGLWAYPMPWTSRPTDLELGNLPDDQPGADMVREQWPTQPPRPIPGRLDDWRALARDTRRERGTGLARVLIGGHITHTRLERGSVISKRILSFDDTGEEFAKMVSNTMHPVALAAPCYCGSGDPFGECHLDHCLALPCYCESGALLGACCWKPTDSGAA